MTFASKLGKSLLAFVLATFVCLCPLAMTALGEEEAADNETASQTETSEGSESVENSDETGIPDTVEATDAAELDTSGESSDTANEAELANNDVSAVVDESTNESDQAVSDDTEEKDGDTNVKKVNTSDEFHDALIAGAKTIKLGNDITLSDENVVKGGDEVTILGNGHKLTLGSSSTLGTAKGGILNLGSASTSSALTITSNGALGHSLVNVNGGTLNMYDGVTLTGNTSSYGGAVSVLNKGVFNMYGGTIDGNNADNGGGAVNVDSKSTFNMHGGVIENNNADYGGGVYTKNATFVMDGNAVIDNNHANDIAGNSHDIKKTRKGGAVFEDRGSHFTMSGNATMQGNSAVTEGGGVFVEGAAIFTMEGNASIVHNSAKVAGGVINYGISTVTTVYDNSATEEADDISNPGPHKSSLSTMTLGPTNPDWVLSSTGTHVTGWYYDNPRHYTDDSGNDANDLRRWTPDNGHGNPDVYTEEYVPTDKPSSEVFGLKAGAPVVESAEEPEPTTPETPKTVDVIWENFDGSVLFELDKVDATNIPAAEKYSELSGNDDPTELSDGTNDYAFEGWEKSVEPDGDVVYTAKYDASPETHKADDSTDSTEPNTETPNTTPSDNGASANTHNTKQGTDNKTNDDNDSKKGSLLKTGDKMMLSILGIGSVAILAAAGIVIERARASRN